MVGLLIWTTHVVVDVVEVWWMVTVSLETVMILVTAAGVRVMVVVVGTVTVVKEV